MSTNISFWQRANNDPLLRIFFIAILALVLQIPVGMIGGLVLERSNTHELAKLDITGKWGLEQHIAGPVLKVPYTQRSYSRNKEGERVEHLQKRNAYFLPEETNTTGQLNTEIRQRGIFTVPVYQTDLVLEGHFQQPDFSTWHVKPADIHWDEAAVLLNVSDPRAIQEQVVLDWNSALLDFRPGAESVSGKAGGIHVPLKGQMAAEEVFYGFKIALVLNGSHALHLAPMAKNSHLLLHGDWQSPSFQGNWLPNDRQVNDSGFSAAWHVPYLGRNFPQSWTGNAGDNAAAIDSSFFGVSLLDTVDTYRLTERSMKYDLLFIGLTFLSLWLLEILIAVRVHAIQYLLVGSGMCLFYLLELSLAEHLGFTVAYFIASVAVVSLVGSYSLAVLDKASRAVLIGSILTGLYGFLFILLHEEDYALLAGSLGIFGILASIMYLTRKVDWFSIGKAEPETNPAN